MYNQFKIIKTNQINIPKKLVNQYTNLLIKIILRSWMLLMITYPAQASYKQDPQYGNGQSAGFINAMYGTSEEFTQAEIRAFNHANYQNNNNKYFLRVGVSSGTNNLNNLKNAATQPAMIAALLTSNKEKLSKKRNLEITLGYQFNKAALEIELMFSQNLKYDQPKLFSNIDGGLKSVVKANTIFVNGYYDILSFKNIDIFLGVGIGLSLNSTNAKFNDIPPIDPNIYYKKNSITGAYNLLIGAKFKLIPQFFIKTSLRYASLAGFGSLKSISTGSLTWQDKGKNCILKGKRSFIGISLSMVHIFI